MQIQVNTDHNIEGHQTLLTHVTSVVEDSMGQMSEHITRVEVHLSDENSDKKQGKDDLRCMMEARLEGSQPVAVTQHAETLHQAIDGAAEKLHRLIDSTLGKRAVKRAKEAKQGPVEL